MKFGFWYGFPENKSKTKGSVFGSLMNKVRQTGKRFLRNKLYQEQGEALICPVKLLTRSIDLDLPHP